MSDSQILLPPSFVDLLAPAGRSGRIHDLQTLLQRHELCEDMAQLLTEHARQVWVKLGITESDVLTKMLQGLLKEEARLSEHEALWVVCRLAELLGWPVPPGLAAPLGEEATAWLERQIAAVA